MLSLLLLGIFISAPVSQMSHRHMDTLTSESSVVLYVLTIFLMKCHMTREAKNTQWRAANCCPADALLLDANAERWHRF